MNAHHISRQVWVVGAELEPGVLSAGSSTFVVVDFFDFESQATPLLPGVSPAFDFATTFKVHGRHPKMIFTHTQTHRLTKSCLISIPSQLTTVSVVNQL